MLHNRVKSCKYSQVEEKENSISYTLKNPIETYKMTIEHVC